MIKSYMYQHRGISETFCVRKRCRKIEYYIVHKKFNHIKQHGTLFRVTYTCGCICGEGGGMTGDGYNGDLIVQGFETFLSKAGGEYSGVYYSPLFVLNTVF